VIDVLVLVCATILPFVGVFPDVQDAMNAWPTTDGRKQINHFVRFPGFRYMIPFRMMTVLFLYGCPGVILRPQRVDFATPNCSGVNVSYIADIDPK
jgi:hypothetical protein